MKETQHIATSYRSSLKATYMRVNTCLCCNRSLDDKTWQTEKLPVPWLMLIVWIFKESQCQVVKETCDTGLEWNLESRHECQSKWEGTQHAAGILYSEKPNHTCLCSRTCKDSQHFDSWCKSHIIIKGMGWNLKTGLQYLELMEEKCAMCCCADTWHQ